MQKKQLKLRFLAVLSSLVVGSISLISHIMIVQNVSEHLPMVTCHE